MATTSGAFVDFGRSFRPQLAVVFGRVRRLLGLWAARRRERLALAEMDERLLRDIGIDRLTARFEAEKPFWEGAARARRRWWR
jgi:uncharacterized protein YjiS (DUF1127 family)